MSDKTTTSRGELFGQPQQSGIQTRNVMKDDFGFEIPVENVPLPSRGTVYAEDSPLFEKETIEIRAMTAREEDILTSRALIKKGTVISHLLHSCLIDKRIQVNSMLTGDRNALMVALRVTGYGAEYNVEVDCPSCGERSKQAFNLTALPLKRLEIDPVSPGANVFEAKLPITAAKVRFKFLTGEDEKDISVSAERRKKQGQKVENVVTQRLTYSIISVNGINDRAKLTGFIKGMPARDSLFLRKFIDKNEPGIDMKSWMDCPHCAEHSEVRLPLGASFFWPDE